ncbi:MAG TPA: cardiolipin synthase [Thermoanaerobaculia bacterium]|nr:cardiolipin synthase [Thermoanaerobaculia bacterium]
MAKEQSLKWIEKRKGTDYVRIPLVLAVALFLTVALTTTLLWSVWRSRSLTLQVKDTGQLEALIPSIAGLTQAAIEPGNRVEVLQNGDGFFGPLLRDIAAARASVHIESYIWWKGTICNQLASLLAEKARQGVEVRLLVDASGGHKMDDELYDLMTQAGCKVRKFHPIRLSNLGRMNNRDHRKLMIIDGRIGYVGGHGIADEWTGNAQDRKHWRDTGLRIEGPIVNRLQGAFSENWIEETGEIPAGNEYFPHLPQAGNTPAHVAYWSPTGAISSVQILHYLAISAARHEIIIQNPYLLPDPNSVVALQRAAQRGVDVKIMVPSADATDSPVVQHASHHLFGTLLKAGVKIWEYEKTLLHQKVLIVDGKWAAVGSTNFDDRSFQLNDELSLAVIDPAIATQLRAAFAQDLRHARLRQFEEWKSRGWWHKTIDGVAYLARDQM